MLQAPGTGNTFVGPAAGNASTTGSSNTAVGAAGHQINTSGSLNTASGENALGGNSTGLFNTASGASALASNTRGFFDTAVGYQAGVTNISANANTTGSDNTFLGANAGPGTPTQLANATAIGANALVSTSNALVLGGTGTNAVKVGIGTQAPQSTLQIAGNGTGHGKYLQIPIVSSAAGPPAGDCNKTNLAGRMVLQDNVGAITLWVCSASSGAWVAK